MGGENEYKHQQIKLSGCGFEEKIKQKSLLFETFEPRTICLKS